MKVKNTVGMGLCLALMMSCYKAPEVQAHSATAQSLGLEKGVGPVCGSSEILGKAEASFSKGACGIKSPVRVYAVGGIKLDQPALVNCKTAVALDSWVKTSAKPEAKRLGKKLEKVNIMAGYSCRNRNGKKSGKLSEHARGNAVDIGGFTFTDGTKLTVKSSYNKYKSYFKTVRKQACGTFGTVLGPGVAYHKDHFHFDTASYRAGPYCR